MAGLYGTTIITKAPPAGSPAGAGSIYQTLGKSNDNAEPWDWFVFNDRDFTSVAELMLVPGCPPGLFTKQFVELPPMVPAPPAPPVAGSSYTTFPVPTSTTGVGGLTFPPPNPPTVVLPSYTVPAFPNAYVYTAPTAPVGPATYPAPQPHTYPYLVDKFFYSGASLPPPATGPTGPAPPFADTDTANESVNTAASDGWFKMFEFFEVPSQMIGSIGSVASGTNFDWARQDTKPGLLNLNLVVDEEVFFSILGKQSYSSTVTGVDQFTQTLLNFTQLMPANASEANLIPQVVTAATATGGVNASYSMLANGQAGVMTGDWLNPLGATGTLGLGNNGMKAAFAQFLLMRHGSLNLFNFTVERPFHSLSYPDIDYTVMRPATLPLAAGAVSNPPLAGVAATGLTPYATGTYAGDPGVRNPFLYPGGFASFMTPPTAMPPSVPPLPTVYTPGTPFTIGLATQNFVVPPPVPRAGCSSSPTPSGKSLPTRRAVDGATSDQRNHDSADNSPEQRQRLGRPVHQRRPVRGRVEYGQQYGRGCDLVLLPEQWLSGSELVGRCSHLSSRDCRSDGGRHPQFEHRLRRHCDEPGFSPAPQLAARDDAEGHERDHGSNPSIRRLDHDRLLRDPQAGRSQQSCPG